MTTDTSDQIPKCPPHLHHLELWPFGQDGQPNDCTGQAHLRSDGNAVWRCQCGERLCRACFEVLAGASGPVTFKGKESHDCEHIFLPEEQVAVAKGLLYAVATCYAMGMSAYDITRVVWAADVA